MSEQTRRVTAGDLIALNKRVLEYGGGQHGIEHETGLRYAAERPWLAFGDIEMYPTPFEKGAVLMENVIRTRACLVIHEASQSISAAMTTIAR